MYNVLTTFRSAGYSTEGRRFLHLQANTEDYATPKKGRDLESRIAPVNGAPCRARDTLLATILRSGNKSAAALLRSNGCLPDWLTSTARIYKRDFPKAQPVYKESPYKAAKNVGSLVGRLIGVEVEYYPRSIHQAMAADKGLTSVVYDGSIGDNGREVRRVTWASKGNRLQGLLGLAPLFEGGKVDKKCGLHVHVDARHLPQPGCGNPTTCDAAETYDRLVRMAVNLKKIIPRSRWNNRYCKFANNRDGSDTFNHSVERYAAINWLAYKEHGSIEFRCGSGSTNIVKIETWALLCRFMLNHCAGRENQVPTNWKGFLAILPEWLASWCILRNLRLHGGMGNMTDRIASAADFSASGSSVE